MPHSPLSLTLTGDEDVQLHTLVYRGKDNARIRSRACLVLILGEAGANAVVWDVRGVFQHGATHARPICPGASGRCLAGQSPSQPTASDDRRASSPRRRDGLHAYS